MDKRFNHQTFTVLRKRCFQKVNAEVWERSRLKGFFKQEFPYTIHTNKRAILFQWLHRQFDITVRSMKIGQPEGRGAHEGNGNIITYSQVVLIGLWRFGGARNEQKQPVRFEK